MLSSLRNMIGSLIHNKSYPFLHQSGFRNHHKPLTSLTEKNRKDLDEGKSARGVFLYFQKAFNSVNHEIFSSKITISWC